MSLTADMEQICHNIKGSHQQRKKYLQQFRAKTSDLMNAICGSNEKLFKETHGFLRNFHAGFFDQCHQEDKQRAEYLKKYFNGVHAFLNRCHSEGEDRAEYIKKKAKETQTLLSAFFNDRKGMHEAWARMAAGLHHPVSEEAPAPRGPKKKRK